MRARSDRRHRGRVRLADRLFVEAGLPASFRGVERCPGLTKATPTVVGAACVVCCLPLIVATGLVVVAGGAVAAAASGAAHLARRARHKRTEVVSRDNPVGGRLRARQARTERAGRTRPLSCSRSRPIAPRCVTSARRWCRSRIGGRSGPLHRTVALVQRGVPTAVALQGCPTCRCTRTSTVPPGARSTPTSQRSLGPFSTGHAASQGRT